MMAVFKRKSKGAESSNSLQFRERNCWAGVMGMCLGYMAWAAWVLTDSFVSQYPILNQVVAAGFLIVVAKLLMEKA